jgi:hypothetical protein
MSGQILEVNLHVSSVPCEREIRSRNGTAAVLLALLVNIGEY